MLTSFLVMFREGLEGALIVTLIAGYLVRSGRAALIPLIWVGVLSAIGLSLFVGAGLQLLRASFPQRAQEVFEGVVAGAAAVLLLSMLVWMRRAGRAMAGNLRAGVDHAAGGEGAGWALIGMTFLAVVREGIESVFFLLALFQQAPGAAAPLGALGGIAASALAGWLLYRGSLHIDLARFFRWTGVLLIVVAAGLMSHVPRALHEAGLFNLGQGTVWDLGHVLPSSSVLGTLLGGLFGYEDHMTTAQFVVWAVTLILGLWLFLRPVPTPEPARA